MNASEHETTRETHDDDELNASIEELARAGRRRSRIVRLIVAVVSVVAVAGFAVFMAEIAYPGVGKYLRQVLAGEQDFAGRRVYKPAHPISAEEFADLVDVEQVHGDLLSGWLAAKSRDRADKLSDETKTRFEALKKAVSGDPNLTELVVEFGQIVHDGVDEDNFDRLSYLAWAWNDYLRQQNQSYYFETVVLWQQDGPLVYVKNYGVVTDLPYSIARGDENKNASSELSGLITQRVDRTNVVENYLCRATSATQRPLWIVDSARRDGAQFVWPMLAAANDATLKPAQQGFAPSIRREAAKKLSAESLAALTRTAPARHRLVQTIATINERQCQKFYISDIPLIAYNTDQIDRLWRFVTRDPAAACPRIREDEMLAFIESSEQIAADQAAIEQALAELGAWVMRPHLMHEIQHYSDATRPFAALIPLECPGCEEYLGARANEELHAYLAGIAYSDAPVMGAYLACHVATTTKTFHKTAIAPIVGRLMKNQSCAEGPTAGDSADELRTAARHAEKELFGRNDQIQAEKPWPEALQMHAP